jgi:hypothetical protein
VLRSSHSHSRANRDAQSLASRAENISTTKRFDKSVNTHLAQRHGIQFAKAHSTHLPRKHDMQHSAGTCHTALSGIQHPCSCKSRHTSFPGITASSLGSGHTSFAGARIGPGPTVLESATSLTRHSFPVSLAGPGPRRVCYCRTEWLGSGRNLLRGPPSNRFEVVRELRIGGLCGTVWCGVLYL